MKRTMQYISPTSLKELQDFQKLNYNFKCEIWKSITIGGWEDFKVSNYGRLFNTKTNKFRKCNIPNNQVSTCDINSIIYVNKIKINGKYVALSKTICDMMLHAFYPDIADTHINPIPIDGNMFNLHLDNIKYVPNAYYEGDDEYKEVSIYLNGEKTNYTIDIHGILINREKGNELIRYKLRKVTDKTQLCHRGKIATYKNRMRYMAEAFIPNPNLNYVGSIDPSIIIPSLNNICWTNRKKLIKK